jgi:type VI secretion system secreted protein VgrG
MDVMRILSRGPITIDPPAGAKALRFRSMNTHEELGRLFKYEIELLGDNASLKPADLLGQPMTVHLELRHLETRHFNGYITDMALKGSSGNFALYLVTVRPWLWLLTRTTNCRIFQNLTVPEILKQIFREHGFTHFQESLTVTYASHEFVVQYRESDFAFVSRLMEQEGIYYFFQHTKDSHTLVLSDSYSAHVAVSGYESVPYFPPSPHRRHEIDFVERWESSHQIEPGAYSLTDFDFERPQANLLTKLSMPNEHAKSDFEMFDYPGSYTKIKDGEHYARLRLEERKVEHAHAEGQTNARGLSVGSLFRLVEHPVEDQNAEYLVTSARCRLKSHDPGSGGDLGADDVFQCDFSVIQSSQPFRSARLTQKPIVTGPQTALVVGKEDEEIWTDNHGRVKLKFHWDRYAKGDESSSCWVRVAQLWAGGGWGGIHIPRIGQEVIVEFLEGDPDRPVVTGRLYNGDNTPPYGLPANQTQSGIKSRSSKGAGASNFNEIRFEDQKGKEELFLQAERNQTTNVKQAQSITVGATRSKTVGSDETITVKGTRTTHVVKKDTVNLDDQHEMTVKLKVSETFKDDHTLAITGAQKITIDKTKTEHVLQSYELTTDKKYNLTQGGTNLTFEGNAVTLDAAGPVTIKRGPATVSIDAAGKISISTPVGISLECGPSSLNLTPSGIELSAAKVAVSAATSTLELSPATAKLSGTVTTVEATTICNVKGTSMLNLNSG